MSGRGSIRSKPAAQTKNEDTESQRSSDRHAAYLASGEIKNGELLQMAEQNGMRVFVTADTTVIHEQNLAGRRLSIIALSTNNGPIIQNHVPLILSTINNAELGSFQVAECGRFIRKQRKQP